MPDDTPKSSDSNKLLEVALLFLKLGLTAFGGPAAHIALIETEVVHRRKWLDRTHFLDMVSALNFIPGPNSTELVIHLGLLRAGYPGLIIAGVCFILPAMLIVLPIAWCYVTFGSTPALAPSLIGIKSAMVAVVLVALIRFAKTGITSTFTAILAVCALALAATLSYFRVPQSELIVLAAAAAAGIIHARQPTTPPSPASSAPKPSRTIFLPLPALPLAALSFSSQLLHMTWFFLKVGTTLFGSGYVLASFLHVGLVEQYRWLTEQELLDAIAVGQITPGPLLTAATFIGYLLGARNFAGGTPGGILAGIVATIAIFLPSFILIALLGPTLSRLRQNPTARAALTGMNAAVVSLIALVTIWLMRSTLLLPTNKPNFTACALFAISMFLLLRYKNLNATWIILGAGAIGTLTALLR